MFPALLLAGAKKTWTPASKIVGRGGLDPPKDAEFARTFCEKKKSQQRPAVADRLFANNGNATTDHLLQASARLSGDNVTLTQVGRTSHKDQPKAGHCDLPSKETSSPERPRKPEKPRTNVKT